MSLAEALPFILSHGTDYKYTEGGEKIVQTGSSDNTANCGSRTIGGVTYDNVLCAVKGGTTQDSICPKGWKLAEYSGNGSYLNLTSAYNLTNAGSNRDTAIQSEPLSFPRAGLYNYSSGALNYRGSGGFYWEGRVYAASNAYDLGFSSSVLSPQSSSYRGFGLSVRCVAR